MHVYIYVHMYIHIYEDVLRQTYYSGYIMAVISRQIYYGRYIRADELRQIYYGRYFRANVLQQTYYRRYITAHILRQIYSCRYSTADMLRQILRQMYCVQQNGHISTDFQRQKLSTAVREPACCEPSPQRLPLTILCCMRREETLLGRKESGAQRQAALPASQRH